MTTNPSVGRLFLSESRRCLAESAKRVKHCLGQLTDEQAWWRPSESQNSIVNLVLHLCGNARQWIIAGAGSLPDHRNRPQEFAERGPLSIAELVSRLEETVSEADAVLVGLSDAQLLEPRRVQGFDTTVLSAIYDSLTHFQGHTQEIIFRTRCQRGDAYQFAWVPTKEQGGSR